MNKNITLQATGEFPFTFYIEKAIPKEDNGMLIVEGVASTVNIDHDNERMAGDALVSMADQINNIGVPLRIEHDKDPQAIVGSVYKAWVDERNQLWIRAAVDPKHPAGPMLHESLRQGAKFGLSVGGRVKNAVRELSEATGKMVKTFYDVSQDEVSVTKRPANYDAWLFAKSYKEKAQDVEPFYTSPLFKEFLSQNPQLDYIQQFSKSIPDKAWKKVEIDHLIIDKNMNDKEEKKDKSEEKEEEKKDKSEEKEEDTEKSFVSKSEFSKFSSDVTKSISALMNLVSKAMDSSAKDTNNPDKDKEETPGDNPTAKSEADGNDGKPQADSPAMDQNAPDKAKEKNPGDGIGRGEEKDEEKEKSEDDEEKKDKSEDEDKKDKSEKDEEDKAKSGDKEPKNLEEATKSIEEMAKRLFGQKEPAVEKSQGTTMDQFAVALSAALMGLEDRVEKSGHRVPGLARMVADTIKGDPEVQKSIAAMLKEPGFKKSVAMGVPYMVSKDGKRFALTATPVEDAEVKKSIEGKSFKDVYKTQFSGFERGQE